MAKIRPFRALRYGPEAGQIAELVAPPYDVLTPEERDELAKRNQHNIVRLTLPESEPDDRNKFVKYGRSATRLAEWRKAGLLVLEDQPTLYRYIQRFQTTPDSPVFERTTFIGLLKTEPYDKGVVLPHEQTFPKHKEDRLRILEATRSHLECIFGLFEDQDGIIYNELVHAPGRTLVEVRTDDGVYHRVDAIQDPATIEAIQSQMADKKVWIADGHHRYETACTFREQFGERDGEIAEDYIMMAFASMSDPGLVLLPTHRVVSDLGISPQELISKLRNHFNIQPCPNKDLMQRITEIRKDRDSQAIALALPDGNGYILQWNHPGELLHLMNGDGSLMLKSLDVTVLHSLIFEKILELKGLDRISYTRNEKEALDAVENGAAAAFLMNPPTVEDMRQIALGGEKMPQKSTFYYPKLLSGLVMWSLEDF